MYAVVFSPHWDESQLCGTRVTDHEMTHGSEPQLAHDFADASVEAADSQPWAFRHGGLSQGEPGYPAMRCPGCVMG